MKNKKGISLIVLVITIIIIIILAGAVILNLADNNPIENASEAQIMSDLDAFNSDLTLQIGNKYLEPNGSMLKTEDFDSDESRDGWKLLDLVPSMKGTGYEEYLAVENGKLKLRIDAEIDDITKEIIETKLGKAVLTKEMILANVDKYIGKKIQYTGYSKNTNDIDWMLFGVDQDTGNILLRANNYIQLDYKNDIEGIKISKNKIYSTNNSEVLIKYLEDSNNWREYEIEGTIAKGTLTLKQFIDSYNLIMDKDEDKFEIKYLTKGEKVDNIEAKSNGYVIRKLDGEYKFYIEKSLVQKYNDMNIYINDTKDASAFWTTTLSAKMPYPLFIYIDCNGNIYTDLYSANYLSVMPVVSLTTATIVLNEDGELVVE